MKKFIYILHAILLTLHSCVNQDPGNWYPEVAEFTGQFVVEVYEGNDITLQSLIVDADPHAPLFITNTSANKSDQIILTDEGSLLGVKVKLDISGTPAIFSSKSSSFNDLYENEYAIIDINSTRYPVPTGLGETYNLDMDAVRIAIEEAKIIPNGATTPGGNITDSIYVKINTFGATLVYESYFQEEEFRVDPNQEYAWRFKQSIANPAYDENYIYSGYRFTGYAEDL